MVNHQQEEYERLAKALKLWLRFCVAKGEMYEVEKTETGLKIITGAETKVLPGLTSTVRGAIRESGFVVKYKRPHEDHDDVEEKEDGLTIAQLQQIAAQKRANGSGNHSGDHQANSVLENDERIDILSSPEGPQDFDKAIERLERQVIEFLRAKEVGHFVGADRRWETVVAALESHSSDLAAQLREYARPEAREVSVATHEPLKQPRELAL